MYTPRLMGTKKGTAAKALSWGKKAFSKSFLPLPIVRLFLCFLWICIRIHRQSKPETGSLTGGGLYPEAGVCEDEDVFYD